jgi:tRNA A-37 threonylcarbamoyl transferase component Bud32/membrane protein YdbS with pleckstrin-like domain
MPAFDFVLGGRYRLVGPLGEGGMATVYRGRDLRLNREVAIKVLRDDLTRDPVFLRRFRQEAQLVASLSHPHIVPVYDVGEEDASHYIVMEYIRGRTLHELLEIGGPLPPQRAQAIGLQVLDALSYAHGQGLVHRDVKPYNILLTTDGTARLADFGIAHLVDGGMTRTAAILGSAHYLSPEQSRGEDATERSDLYACAVVLYEMLAGSPPFTGPNALAVAHQHLHATPPAFASERGVPPALASLIMRGLSKDPSNRFASAQEFAQALERVPLDPGVTTVAPLVPIDETSSHPLVRAETAPRRPQDTEIHAHDDVERIEIRRSARKLALIGVVCAAVLGAVAYALQASSGTQRLPHLAHIPAYPSAPYAAVPGLLLLLLCVAWINVRAWRYTMDSNAAVVHWGLVGHHRFGVPVRFVTAIELKQSPIDRVLGVGTLQMTARDQHGEERQIVLVDVAHPRDRYEELVRGFGALRTSRS